MKEKIKSFAKKLQIEYTGIVSAAPMVELREILSSRRKTYGITSFEEADLDKRTVPELTIAGAKSIVVCLFPYYNGPNNEGNLSRFARIPDYHKVVMERLEKICEFIKQEKPDANFLPFVDSGPLADKFLAYQAGLGFFGKNSLLINEKYGSYVFIGYIITDLDLAPDAPLEKSCDNCGRCIRACPGGALKDAFDFNAQSCVSHITQLKTISNEQEKILRAQSSVYGCDICQEVCPHNANIPLTPIAEFQKPFLNELEEKTLRAMSNREFTRTYKNSPFSWRGKSAILKNFMK